MKNLIIFIGLLFIFCVPIFAQENSPCPNISVSENLGNTNSLTLTANISNLKSENVGYIWTVSKGTIFEGQGTPNLIILRNVGEVTATVEVTGLPKVCSNVASIYMCLLPNNKPLPTKISESSLPLPRIQKAEWDGLFISLNNDSSATGYILERIAKNTPRKLLEQKFTNIFKTYSFKKSPFFDRVKLFVGRSIENTTEMWIKPAGADVSPFENVSNPIEITPQNYKRELAKLFPSNQKTSPRKIKKN